MCIFDTFPYIVLLRPIFRLFRNRRKNTRTWGQNESEARCIESVHTRDCTETVRQLWFKRHLLTKDQVYAYMAFIHFNIIKEQEPSMITSTSSTGKALGDATERGPVCSENKMFLKTSMNHLFLWRRKKKSGCLLIKCSFEPEHSPVNRYSPPFYKQYIKERKRNTCTYTFL